MKSHLSTIVFLAVSCAFISVRAPAQEKGLVLNDLNYYETRGFNVIAFENAYTGFFFDEKTSGIMLIQHGIRTATGGAVRLKPTPEQWDQIPEMLDRVVDRETNSIGITLRYPDYDFDSKILVRPEGKDLVISVTLEKSLPERLEGRAGFNLEFLPAAYFEKTYVMDGVSGIFPLYPSGPMIVRPDSTQLRQFAGHSTFDDRGRKEYVEPLPLAEGRKLLLSPGDPETRIQIESVGPGKLRLLDGRNVAQNGWFVVRTLIPEDRTGKVIEWKITPSIIPEWTRDPVIGHSQVGYRPGRQKVAVIELDPLDRPLEKASLLYLEDDGTWNSVYEAPLEDRGDFYRYHYLRFDFSSVCEPGIYAVQYGKYRTDPFQIGDQVYDHLWEQTLDVWFPVQMDHMFVNEAYRVWHGAAHLDDARQAPPNVRHFDGYRMGDSTETKYRPGEHIPGLNIGGWFDAGDYDIRTGSHSATVLSLVETWEQFGITRDETLVDQEFRFVDLHHPDGKPDLLQQIEHGTLALIAQQRAFGRAIPGIIVPNLHQYHHLGDGSTMTDNLVYNPSLEPYESDGITSGTPDDRWAFTTRMAGNSYASIEALAAASRALRGYNEELAEECLQAAVRAWKDELEQPVDTTTRWGMAFPRTGELRALLQLYISTHDETYAKEFEERLWESLDRNVNRSMQVAARALPYMDRAYGEKLGKYVNDFREFNDELLRQNPYGVPISSGGWAGNSGIISWAATNYLLHRAFPEIIGPEYTFRGLDYIYGCHPYSDISFVSGVGLHSKKVAYGNNRADFSFIAGGVVPGILVIKPDFPENMTDWPYLWGENEYVINICAEYIFLAAAVKDLK
jgi:endoglucanase